MTFFIPNADFPIIIFSTLSINKKQIKDIVIPVPNLDVQKELVSKINIILSNFQSKPFQQLLKNNPFLTKAKGIVVSANVMMKKPEIGIYHFLLSQYRLLPHECIFIDDMKDNIN